MNKITGTIRNIFEPYQAGLNQYRQFWVTTHEQNPQVIRFQMSGDKVKELDKFREGETVEVHFAISGRPRIKGRKEELYNNNNAIDILTIIEE